jgi:hypothetical protein
MDDNQNEWGDEDLETKKFRVSPAGFWAIPEERPVPGALCDVVLCSSPPNLVRGASGSS